MAVGVIVRIPGQSRSDYEAVNAKLNIDPASGNGWPSGMLSHAAGEADGGLVLMQVWESKEAHERFAEQRVRPALAAAGRSSAPEVTYVDLIEYHTPKAVPA